MAPIEVRGHLYSLSRPSLYEARRIIIDTFSAMAPKRLIINHGASDPIHSLQSSRSLHSTYSLPGVSAFTSRMMNAVARSFFCWSAVATFLCPAGGMNSQQLTMAIPSPRAPVGGSYLLGLGERKAILDADAMNANGIIFKGIADVTGPVVETNMFGYASLDQNDAGIHMRQRSRAYIIADSADPTQRVVFVNSDISSGDTAVRKGILDRLQQLYPGVYTESNFALAGTHSHAGVGGYVNNLLPQLTSLGFVRQTYDAIVNGTVLSIVRAHESLAPGTLSIGNTTVIDGAINRSPFSYLQNPLEERNRYPGDLEKELSLLKFTDSATGVDRGFLSFFAVHGTSLYMNNTLVSTDNKGMAAYLYESFMEPYALPGKNKFVAGFAQSTSGDVSPNTLGAFCESPGKPWHGQPCDFEKSTCGNRTQDCRGRGPGYQTSDFLSNEIIGRKQFDAARILMEYSDDALAPINGPVKSFHTYVDIGNYQFTLKNGKPAKTCKAALGFSFAGGTT
ncbi:hypothetical protein FRC03_005332 [Tulasnella sp. 419]|nr:hypothetical protein FRC03_005332 [Tulasnella sp. 419]